MRHAPETPILKIASHACLDDVVIIQEVCYQQKNKENSNISYNVIINAYGDMIESGIPDPAKVTRNAVENAASINAMILTTEVPTTDVLEESMPMPAAPDGIECMH